ncbi:MAG: hypothetical protein JXA94_07405 [Parachlamydiales bacterium]|nr:hypothetical protein [Parachlamydiales bacterium]
MFGLTKLFKQDNYQVVKSPITHTAELKKSNNSAIKEGIVIAGKELLVASTIAGLAFLTIHLAGIAHSASVMGASSWQTWLYGGLGVASGVTTLGSVYFAAKKKLYKYTENNLKDCAEYIGKTALTGLYCAASAIDLAQQIGIWTLIIKYA